CAQGNGDIVEISSCQRGYSSIVAERTDGIECRCNVVLNSNGKSSSSSALTCIGSECVLCSSCIVNSGAPGTGNAVERSSWQRGYSSTVAERTDGIECRCNVVLNSNGKSRSSSALTCIGSECVLCSSCIVNSGAPGTGNAVER